MALLSGELRLDEGMHQILGQFLADHSRPQNQDVDIVVFHHLVSRIGVMSYRGPDSVELVGSDAGTGT